jgi:hypothetical protein
VKRKFFLKDFKKRPLFWLALLAYTLSLAIPAFGDFQTGMFGFTVLYAGWLGLIMGMYAWLSNIFILVGLIFSFFKAYWFGLMTSITAILIGLQSFAFDWYSRGFEPYDAQGPFYLSLKQLSIGFYLWELSFILLFLFCLSKILPKKFLPKLKV